MKKIENKIKILTEKIKDQNDTKNEVLFLNEMKKIGIEKLPYSYSALKQFIDPETMSYHYNQHYKGYVDKLNDALSKKNYGDLDLEQIVRTINKFDKTIRNNAGGAFNHALFWKMLSPTEQKCNGKILAKIKKDFKSFREFKTEFETKSKTNFGSGWVWLVLTKRGSLKIMTTPNQDNPLMNIIDSGGYPLLGLDLWEHAYYLKYRNKKDEYIKNFWKAVNWEFVNKLFEMKVFSKINETTMLRQVITESVSESCSKSDNEAIRFIFNVNPIIKQIYRAGIDSALKSVFSENYYERGEAGGGEMSGVYNLEGEGRSVLNKMNTNYSCFCILMKDINKLLSSLNQPTLDLIGQTPKKQIDEVNRMVSIIDQFKFRIFATKSKTFQNILSTLSQNNKLGDEREDKTVVNLKKIFGNDNVIKVGKLGDKDDMIGGIDAEIMVDGKKNTAQIKPFKYFTNKDGKYTIFGTANVKSYKTDLLIFIKYNNDMLIFNNDKTKIIGGNFVFSESSLIYPK